MQTGQNKFVIQVRELIVFLIFALTQDKALWAFQKQTMSPTIWKQVKEVRYHSKHGKCQSYKILFFGYTRVSTRQGLAANETICCCITSLWYKDEDVINMQVQLHTAPLRRSYLSYENDGGDLEKNKECEESVGTGSGLKG